MMIPEATRLHRALMKCDQIERELRKHPDFQLYLLTRSKKDRARMERMLMEIPNFRLWRALTKSVGRARRRGMASTAADAQLVSEYACRRADRYRIATDGAA